MHGTFMLHSGANRATIDQVRAVIAPEATETWQPIAHHELVELVLAQFTRDGLSLVREEHGLWRDGLRYFGLFQLLADHQDHGIVVGLRNSHDKTFPAGLVCGANVFVCDNLSFSGEIKFSRRHSSGIRKDLPRVVNIAVGKLGEARRVQAERFEAYKAQRITDGRALELVTRAAIDAKALPVKLIPAVVGEYRQPKHKAFETRTAWSLFNAFTEVYKTTSPVELPARSIALHGVIDRACGVSFAPIDTTPTTFAQHTDEEN